MASKNDKLPLSAVKKLPYKSLNRMIKKMREFLKHDGVVQEMFKEYGVDIEEIDLIPMKFGNLDVSAKTDHGVITFNYKLLTDGDFFKDFSYGVHEMTHWLQQTTGSKATKSSDDGSYLDNPYEQEGFQNQVQYIADQFGEGEAEKYVDDLLEHHEVEDKKEVEEKKDTLMIKVKASKNKLVSFDFDNTLWDPEKRQFISNSVDLLKKYMSSDYKVMIITHRNHQGAEVAKNLLHSIGIDIPILPCPGNSLDSRFLDKNKALLALRVQTHYDDRADLLKDAIAGGVIVKNPPKEHA